MRPRNRTTHVHGDVWCAVFKGIRGALGGGLGTLSAESEKAFWRAQNSPEGGEHIGAGKTKARKSVVCSDTACGSVQLEQRVWGQQRDQEGQAASSLLSEPS